jgi:hypothetical protein
VYRDGIWFVRRSSDGTQMAVSWGGLPQDLPLNWFCFFFENSCRLLRVQHSLPFRLNRLEWGQGSTLAQELLT